MQLTYAQHQLEASYFLAQRKNVILACATGTGKTVMMILTALRLLKDCKIKKAIICATKGSLPEICEDFKKFYGYEPAILDNSQYVEQFFISDKPIGLTRYEWFKKIDPEILKSYFLQYDCAFFVDEAQKLKNPGTQVFKYVKNIRPTIAYYYPVTATPLMTNLDDLYYLMYLTDPRVLDTYCSFMHNYYVTELVPRYPNLLKGKCPKCGGYMKYVQGLKICVRCGNRINVPSKYDLIEYKNLDELSQIMKNYMFCYYPEQDIRHEVYRTEISDFKEYYKVAKDLIKTVDENDSTPFSTRIINLQYQTSNDINKLKLLKSLLDKTLHEGLVIYCCYHQSIELIQAFLDSLKIPYKTISGNVKDSERQDAKNWFKSGAAGKVLILSQAGGASLNLQVTPHFCFYEIPWGYGQYSQCIGRICRMFSKYKTFYIYYLCLNNTIDFYKYECIASYAPIVRELFRNKYVPTGAIKNWNKHIISQLRNSLCWLN